MGDGVSIKINAQPGEVRGRNGTYEINKVWCWTWGNGSFEFAQIEGVSTNTGKVINGYICLPVEAMDQLATEWCKQRGIGVGHVKVEVRSGVAEFTEVTDGIEVEIVDWDDIEAEGR